MIGIDGMTLLIVATAAFAILLFILAGVATTTVIVNRHRPTIAQAVRAEERRDLAEVKLEKVQDELRSLQARLAEADKKAAEVAWLEERLSGLRMEIEQLEPRRREIITLQEELEDIVAKNGDANREFGEISDKLEEARDAARRLERLEADIEARQAEAERLALEVAELTELREEAARLRLEHQIADQELEKLSDKQVQLEGKIAVLEASIEAGHAMAQRMREETAELENRREELRHIRTRLLEAEQDIDELQSKRNSLEGLIGGLEAQAAELRGEIAGGQGRPGTDPLADLRVPPIAIENIRVSTFVEVRGEDRAEESYLQRAKTAIRKAGLTFHDRTIRAFHTSLKVSPEAPMTVLAGISGTGKTQLPRRYAEGIGIGFLPMAVQPRWDSPQDLLGFYNFIEQRYKATELSRAMYQLDGQGEEPELMRDRMLLVLLDEMNLARVEYYFSEFLSRLELRPTPSEENLIDRRSVSEIVIEAPGGHEARIFPGHNLLFAGTMNEDESTQSLSDKVLDRGNMLRFPPPKTLENARVGTSHMEVSAPISYSRWRSWRRSIGDIQRRDWANGTLEKLSIQMKEIGRPFGHRVGQAILSYAANYPAPDGRADDILEAAFADQVEMRLLPKLRGVELEDNDDKIRRLADTVTDVLRDEDLANAIEHSIESSKETDRFAWQGLAR